MALDRPAMLAINRIRAITLAEKIRLSDALSDHSAFAILSKERMEQMIGRSTRIRTWEPSDWLQAAFADEKGLTDGEFNCTFYLDPDYPPLLREIHDPPFLLFYRGKLPDPTKPLLAVVGTRRPSGCGRKAAFAFGLDAGRCGVSVVSGLARGIDFSAHKGNLAGGGLSVGVLGCGIDRIYPTSSIRAAHELVLSGGCVLSEYGTGVVPMRYHFPERNRIISGLARSVVVVEAPERSGALITADFALEQGRDLLVHAGCLEVGTNEGCRRLRFDGAEAVESATAVLRKWGIGTAQPDGESTILSVKSDTGSAKLLERELKGELVTYAGEYFEK